MEEEAHDDNEEDDEVEDTDEKAKDARATSSEEELDTKPAAKESDDDDHGVEEDQQNNTEDEEDKLYPPTPPTLRQKRKTSDSCDISGKADEEDIVICTKEDHTEKNWINYFLITDRRYFHKAGRYYEVPCGKCGRKQHRGKSTEDHFQLNDFLQARGCKNSGHNSCEFYVCADCYAKRKTG